MIYLDRAATTPVRPEVVEAMWPYLTEKFGNAASHHPLGFEAAEAVEWAQCVIAAEFGATPGGVVFTSGGTEADNLAIKGIALADPRGRHIVTTAIEHPAVLESCDFLERFFGFDVTRVGVDNVGMVRLDELAAAVRADTTLVSVMAANNEIGTVQPIAEVAAIAAARGVPIHVDAVQAAAAMPLNLRGLGLTAMTLSGHKLGAPKGVGALLLAPGVVLEPVLHGGGQQDGRRSGTVDVASAVGLGVAVQLAAAAEHLEARRVLADATQTFIADVLANVPGARLTGHPTARLPGHASFCFEGISGESVVVELGRQGVSVSSGSACAAGSSEPSAVLLACGISPELAQSAVRFSFDVDAVAALSALVEVLSAVVAQARSLGGMAPGGAGGF